MKSPGRKGHGLVLDIVKHELYGAGMRPFVDWFPCVFMRADREKLRAAFPEFRLPLERPVDREVANPFSPGERLILPSRDPAPEDRRLRVAPMRPPLPFCAFWTRGYWHEEFPTLFSLATGVQLDSSDDQTTEFEEAFERGFIVQAMFGPARLHDCDLELWKVGGVFRDALARLDELEASRLGRSWVKELNRLRPDSPPFDLRQAASVHALAQLSRAAADVGEDLVIWSNT